MADVFSRGIPRGGRAPLAGGIGAGARPAQMASLNSPGNVYLVDKFRFLEQGKQMLWGLFLKLAYQEGFESQRNVLYGTGGYVSPVPPCLQALKSALFGARKGIKKKKNWLNFNARQ